LTDHYKTLNLPFGASETEIKKRFRKLATIHHPDKNGGSKKSEEIFKVILNAYETLSEKDRRAIYDIKYKQQFQQTKTESTNRNSTNSNTTQEQPKQSPPRNREYQRTEKTKPKLNYSFWAIAALLALLYLYNANKTTTTGNSKADKQLEEQEQENRPQSGEIDFNN
jgi:DnaJ-class molecular chaperone